MRSFICTANGRLAPGAGGIESLRRLHSRNFLLVFGVEVKEAHNKHTGFFLEKHPRNMTGFWWGFWCFLNNRQNQTFWFLMSQVLCSFQLWNIRNELTLAAVKKTCIFSITLFFVKHQFKKNFHIVFRTFFWIPWHLSLASQYGIVRFTFFQCSKGECCCSWIAQQPRPAGA